MIRRRAVGHTVPKIAAETKATKLAIHRILASPEGRAHLEKLMDDIDADFVRAAALAPFASLAGGAHRRKSRAKSG